jgi:hypothetical protein
MAQQPPNLYAPRNPVPAKPIVQSYPTPNLDDRIYVVRKDTRAGGFKLPTKGDPYEGPEAEKFEGFIFSTLKPSDQTGWVDLFYLNDRLNQNEYNLEITYPWVSKDYPRYTRTYVVLRSDYEDPEPSTPDPVNSNLLLVTQLVKRFDDPVLDSLFVGVQCVFERVPAPIAYEIEKFESVLPYKMRVAVPQIITTTVEEGPAQAPTAPRGTWSRSESTDSAFRKTVKEGKRDLPAGGITFISEKLTRDKQVAKVTESWKDEQQHVVPTATMLDGEVEQVGDGTTIKSTTETDDLFPERSFAAQIEDPVPAEFSDLAPLRTEAETLTGQASPPDLGPGELRVSEAQKDEFNMRREKVVRKVTELPKTKKDYQLGGIQTHGSEFGGTLETASTLDNKPQQVEEGFDIIGSSVKSLAGGLSLRKTTRLFTGGNGTGPYLELIDGGDSYVDDPAIVFDSDRGSGAAGAATISQVELNPDLDAGGDFSLAFGSAGDNNGVFNFLGERYNNGTWTNPVANGTVGASAHSTNPPTPAQLAYIADQDTTKSLVINPVPGGGNSLELDWGVGRELTPNRIAIRGPSDALPGAVEATKFEVWGYNTFGETSDITKLGGPFTLPANSTWGDFALTATRAYRYMRINAADLSPLGGGDILYPSFFVPEIELYGDLHIAPGVQLGYAFNGDQNGVFYYLGQRGGGGTWRNPQTNGDIVISAPYDSLELGTFDSIVDRAPSNTYLAQRNGAELWFDIGADRSLLLTTLAFQSRADYGSAMTTVSIQGSADGVTWEEAQRLTVDYHASSWTKLNITSLKKYYRFFRLILPADKGWLMLGELEMYGSLRIAPAEVATNYSVTGVNVTNGGTNYGEAPIVEFSGGGGTGAAATATVEDGVVVAVTVTNSGTGYTSAPSVAFVVPGQGSGATAASHISGGAVTSIDVVDGGGGYTEPPVVKIVSATGSGAVAEAVLTGDVVTSITVTSGGSGYALPPTVVLYPATDPEGEAEIGFELTALEITNRGSGYTNPPAVKITGSGSEAQVSAELGFGIHAVQLTDGGDNYTSAPTPVFAGNGSGAAATARIAKVVASAAVTAGGSGYLTEPEVQASSGNAQFRAVIGRPILTIGLTVKGSGYTSDPTVVISGDGSAAAAHVVRSFGVASIPVTAGGSAYTVAPDVIIAAPTGNYPVQATAHAVLVAGAVDHIVIDNPGSGYLTAPTATLSGGDGTGATIGTVVLVSGGAVDSIVIDNHGTGYTTASISFTGGSGSGAAAVTGLDTSTAGPIKVIEVTNPGTDYETAPTLTILPGTSGGTGATGTASLSSAGRVIAVDITSPGELYSGPVTLSFTGGGGSGAAGTVVKQATGKIKSLTIITPGDGFRDDTEIEFIGGGGTGAAATATRGGCGSVVQVRLVKPGGPFTVVPTVRFVGGQSQGCVAVSDYETIFLGATLGFPSGDVWTGDESGSFLLLYGDHGGVPAKFGTLSVRRGVNPNTSNNAWVIGNGDGLGYESVLQNMYIDMAISVGVAYEVKVVCELLPSNIIRIHPTVNGVEGTGQKYLYIARAVQSSIFDDPMWEALDEFYIGSVEPGANILPVDVTFDNLKIGTSEGGSDIFEFNFDSPTFIPPFVNSGSFNTSTVGAGGLRVQTHDYGSVSPILPGGFVSDPVVFPTSLNGKWRVANPMPQANATNDGGGDPSEKLADGRVLVTGGSATSSGAVTTCNIYDPSTGTWAATGSLAVPRKNHVAIKLLNGKILVLGGNGNTTFSPVYTCELYDPATGAWSATGSMLSGGSSVGSGAAYDPDLTGFYTHACLLADGRVLALTGFRNTLDTQIYNPSTGTWSVAAHLAYEDTAVFGWINSKLTLLPNGKVLATYGRPTFAGSVKYGLYNPATDTWAYANVPGFNDYLHSAILLDNGLVFVSNGLDASSGAALYDYNTDSWTNLPADTPHRYGRCAIKLLDGRVMLVGGNGTSPNTNYTIFNPVDNSYAVGPSASVSVQHDHSFAELLNDGSCILMGGVTGTSSRTDIVEIFGQVPTPATAVYKLGSSWPTLIEEQTDPTEGIRTRLTKSIVPARTPLPEGFAESFPLDIYRSIQIVSKVDLNSLPPPISWKTSQHISFPPQLLSVYPLWDKSQSQSTAGGGDTGTNRGSVSASVEVHGAIVITKRSGFRGAAMGRIERQFFASLEAAEAAVEQVEPTIIQPASGTVILRTTSASASNEGLTYDQSPPLNAQGQPAKVGDTMPGGGTYAGGFGFATKATSSGSSGSRTQVTDINDVLSAGVNIATGFTATNQSSADVLKASAVATGTFSVVLPASTPTIIVPGQAVLAEVNLEKWRFGIYVRHLIYLAAPA